MTRKLSIRRFLGALALGLLMALVPASPASAAVEGDLDPTFDGDGQLRTPISPGDDVANAVALQSDGKIVVAGYATFANKDIAVARYLRTGALDPSFSGDGLVGTAIGPGDEVANAMVIQPDGKIIVAGYADNGTDLDIALVRYLPNGSPDPAFGIGGVVTLGIGAGLDVANAVALQPNGRIVVAGFFNYGATDDMAVVRYTPGGARDSTFDGDGIQTTTGLRDANHDRANDVAIQPDGKIVLAGYTSFARDDTTLVRYTPTGALDTGFGAGGIQDVNAGLDDRANAVTILPGGKILTAGYRMSPDPEEPSHLWKMPDVLRYRNDGSLDSTFGGAGQWSEVRGQFNEAKDMALQPDGRILILRDDFGPSAQRVNTNGTTDFTYGSVVGTFQPHTGASLAIQPDGKIVVAGSSGEEFGVSRFIGDATPPWGARVIGVPRYSLSTTGTVYWTASDVGTGVASFDVQRQQAQYSAGTYGPWSTLRSATPLTAGAFAGNPGFTYCFRVRGRDFAGNVGSYSSAACEAIPLDERTMTASGSWTNLSGSSYYLGTAMRSTTQGATLSISARYRHLAVVVTSCPGCGALQIFRGSVLLKSVSLNSTSIQHKRVIEVAASTSPLGGVITLKQASAGKNVTVEGLAVSLA